MGRFTDYKTFRTALGGRLLEVEIGKVAEQANGQAVVRYGDTVVSCTVCARFLPADMQLRREDVCSRQDPWRIYQERGPSF